MSLPIDEDLIERFLTVVDQPPPPRRQKEQVVHDFLEENSVLLPTPKLENHGLHHGIIISKFPLSPAFTTDYVYLTKSSSNWVIRFVELEQPDKAIFTQDMNSPVFSATFNAALGQVEQWMAYADTHRQDIINRLAPFISPMSGNPVNFEYELVIGRSKNKNASAGRRRMFEQKRKNSGIHIYTYDQLIDFYRTAPRHEKHILSLNKERYKFKYMGADLGSIFAYLGPDVLNLSPAQVRRLKAETFHMDAWRDGTLLTLNGKWVREPVGKMVRAALDQAMQRARDQQR